jgi:hypothetical protein
MSLEREYRSYQDAAMNRAPKIMAKTLKGDFTPLADNVK